MAVSDWKFFYGPSGFSIGTEFTSNVLSASMFYGRTKYLDDYSAGTLTITINNSANFASNFAFNTGIILKTDRTGVFPLPNDPQNTYFVQEITFADHPGNVGLSTATLFCVDALGRAGRVEATNLSLTQQTTGLQATQFTSLLGGPLPSTVKIQNLQTQSTASAQTYTGTVLNQLNLLNATERGTLRTKRDSAAGQINFHGRKQIDAVTVVSFGRNTSASVIGYQQFNRIQNGLSFINTATISPEGLPDQTVSNASSVSTYGATFYSSSTVDVDTTQAQGNANWVVNSFSDPTDLRFEIAFTDRAQNDTAYDLFMIHRNLILFNLSYRLPTDVADTTELVALEGYSVNMTPEQTDWVLYFSPATYYQFFTLDSSTFGILGGGGIVYDQPEIKYDEIGWIYDDANVEQGSRLGW
jgi:hypothetical protein